ncbi:helix-turn-helix domain-containing protein [Peptoniphilus sp. AGMB00490]|uniref:Helix-turn-helix domain-containing protein n=1 Tax=Peptoniphilus faecalis TaxID=2731255 RepID=A0A848RA73_9FIRM|nr:helix-turn-helix domain-containing protein [Peptoniphilus faecalis]NMW84718.1 helix-turn-helix domain-containing protein [Peptoniphilus faecalis]
MEKEYYINIPSQIIENKNLSSSSKLLYGELIRLSTKEGYCFASNKYLGELVNKKERTIQKLLKELKESNLIKIYIENINQRKIYIQN